jgi:hypothetical protein
LTAESWLPIICLAINAAIFLLLFFYFQITNTFPEKRKKDRNESKRKSFQVSKLEKELEKYNSYYYYCSQIRMKSRIFNMWCSMRREIWVCFSIWNEYLLESLFFIQILVSIECVFSDQLGFTSITNITFVFVFKTHEYHSLRLLFFHLIINFYLSVSTSFGVEIEM